MKPKVANENGSRRIMSLREGREWGLKILVSAVQSRPCPPFLSTSCPSVNSLRSEFVPRFVPNSGTLGITPAHEGVGNRVLALLRLLCEAEGRRLSKGAGLGVLLGTLGSPPRKAWASRGDPAVRRRSGWTNILAGISAGGRSVFNKVIGERYAYSSSVRKAYVGKGA